MDVTENIREGGDGEVRYDPKTMNGQANFNASPGRELSASRGAVNPSAQAGNIGLHHLLAGKDPAFDLMRHVGDDDRRYIGCDSKIVVRTFVICWALYFLLACAAVGTIRYIAAVVAIWPLFQLWSLSKRWRFYGYSMPLYYALNASAVVALWFAAYPMRLLAALLLRRYSG